MKRFLISAVILFLFWGLLYAITVFLAVRFVGLSPINGIKPFFISLYIFSLFYGKYWSLQTLKKPLKLISFIAVFVLFFFTSYYIYAIIIRSKNLYRELTAERYRGWRGNPHITDDTLGLIPVKNGRGYHVFPLGDDIPMAYNAQGFRVALNDTGFVAGREKTDVLFLGCSYTYGDACYAEQTFSYLVGKTAGLNIINAGVCSYGLSQMYILSGRLISRYKPAITVVQFSPWLVDRATSYSAPASTFLSVPYFSETGDSVALQMPFTGSDEFRIDRKEINRKYKGSYLTFLVNFALPYFITEDLKRLRSAWPEWMGGVKAAAADKNKVERIVYNAIIDNIKAAGSTPVVLCLGDTAYSRKAVAIIGKKALIVNADSALWSRLSPATQAAFSLKYHHWRKTSPGAKDSVLVDTHPNPVAHRIIADEIIKKIKQ